MQNYADYNPRLPEPLEQNQTADFDSSVHVKSTSFMHFLRKFKCCLNVQKSLPSCFGAETFFSLKVLVNFTIHYKETAFNLNVKF